VEKVYPEDMLTKLVPDYRYWVGRGISEDVLRRLEGGMAPTDERSKLSGRFILPIRDDKRRIIGWTGRLVSDASFGPKHKHLVKSSKAVYPIHIAAEPIRTSRKVVLTEGVGDLMTLHTHGMLNVLVLLGLNLNARMLGFLASVNATHIVLSTNNDSVGAKGHDVGNKAADKLRAKLIPFFGEERVVIRLPQTGKDWGEASVDEVKAFKAEVDAL
jgi:DNA primase